MNLITRPEAQKMGHRLRSECMAVLVGKNTVLADNPRLTTRAVEGPNPVRAFIDRKLEVPPSAAIYSEDAPTWVFNELKDEKQGGLHYIRVDFSGNVIEQVMHKFYQRNIQSVLVEGGARLLNDLIAQEMYDEVFVFENPDLALGNGIRGPEFPLPNTFELVGEDKLYHHVNELLFRHRPH